jgi:hypothetical protein
VESTCGHSITWKVVDKHVPPKENIMDAGFDEKTYGLRDFVMGHYKKSEVLAMINLQLSFPNQLERKG